MKILAAFGFALLLGSTSVFGADPDRGAAETKSYQIRNVKFGDLLRPKNASNSEGTRIVLYPAQPWKCMTWKLHPAGEPVFQLQNHFTSKTIVAKTNSAVVSLVQTAFSREKDERPGWRVIRLSDGKYQINDARSGLALTAVSSDRGAVVILERWADKAEQKWELIETDPAKLTM